MKASAFTLLECLITLAILSLLFFFCLPFTSTFYSKNEIDVLEKQIVSAVQYSRHMALMMGKDLTLSPFPETGDWSEGMILFVDNKTHHYSPTDQLLYQWHWPLRQVQVLWHGFRSNDYLIFSAHLTQATTNGHFLIMNGQIEQKKITINRLGRVVAN